MNLSQLQSFVALTDTGSFTEAAFGFVILPAQGVEGTLITADELCVLVASGHRLYAKNTVTPTELSKEGFVLEKTPCTLHLMKRAGLFQEKNGPHIRYQASDSATILAMVREGLGITLMPRMMLPQKLEGIVALALDPLPQLQIGLAVRTQKTASRAAKLFIEEALAWARRKNEHL